MKALIIEDDPDIADLIRIHLSDLNLDLSFENDGIKGLEIALSSPFDIYILDVMLPGCDGLEICKQIRNQGITSGILMLTAKSDEIDKVLGLEMGADDYLTKPFGIREFISRVKAIIRRLEMSPSKIVNDHISIDGLEIIQASRKVVLDGNRVELTPKEYDLLYLLAQHPGNTFSRQELLSKIWGYEFAGYEHTVNSHINRLRSKIEPDPAKPKYIITSWGVGYRMNEDLV